MKRSILATLFIFVAAILAPLSTQAQTVGFTASHIQNAAAQPLASGQLCLMPVDNNNHPVLAKLGGTGGAVVGSQACGTVTAGVLQSGFVAPDTALTAPLNLCLRVTITDSNQNGKVVYSSPCAQPASSGQTSWCSTSTCNFDNYAPNVAAQALVQTGPIGPQGPPGTGSIAGLTSDGASGINVAANVKAATVNGIWNAASYAPGSVTGGIQEAYTACVAGNLGCVVQLAQPVTITASQTISVLNQHPLELNCNGQPIHFSHSSGAGLILTTANPNTLRYAIIVHGCTFDYTGSGTGITGLQIGTQATAAVDYSVYGNTFNSFPTGSIALDLNDAEEGHVYDNRFNANAVSVKLDLATNQNELNGNWIQGGKIGIICTDCQEAHIHDNTFQSMTGTSAIQLNAATVSIVHVAIVHNHFENNGDGTVGTHQIALNAATGLSITWEAFEHNVFNPGVNGANSYVYGFSGAGALGYLAVKANNYASGFTSIATGFPVALTEAENDNGGPATVGLNINGNPGMSLCPISGTCFRMFSGYTGLFAGYLQFWDDTNSRSIASWNGSVWSFLGGISTPAISGAAVSGTTGAFSGAVSAASVAATGAISSSQANGGFLASGTSSGYQTTNWAFKESGGNAIIYDVANSRSAFYCTPSSSGYCTSVSNFLLQGNLGQWANNYIWIPQTATAYHGPATGGPQLSLTGTTGTITGTALSASCDSGTVTVTGAVVGHPVAVGSTTGVDVGGAFDLRASVTATNTVTVYVCGTGTPASLAYNVTVF